MRADPVYRRDHPINVEEGIDPTIMFDLLRATWWKLAESRHLDESWHESRCPFELYGQALSMGKNVRGRAGILRGHQSH
jgi:hypothetical protein